MEERPSIGICHNLKDWLNTRVDPYYSSTYFKKIYTNVPFKNKISNPPSKYPYMLEGGYVGIIPKSYVLGHNGAVITPDRKLIWDVSHEYVNSKTEHSVYLNQHIPVLTEYERLVAILSNQKSSNYFHWMFEVIPRVHLLQKAGIKAEKYIIKYEPDLLPVQKESLSIVGIKEDQIIRTYPNFHAQVEYLVVPSQPLFYPTLWAYNFLRGTFLDQSKGKQGKVLRKKVYIKRTGYRRLINEEEVINLLCKHDFEIVELSNLTLYEQVNIFSNADTIIGVHGAGLSNLVFSNPKTKVLEIFPESYVNSLYWLISSLGRLEYYYIIGSDGGKDSRFKHSNWQGYENIKVDINIFKKLLNILEKEKD